MALSQASVNNNNHHNESNKVRHRGKEDASSKTETQKKSSNDINNHEDHSEIVKLLLKDNPHITTGFRRHTEMSYAECLKSVFTLHNDTLNIWSHLLFGVYMIYLLIQTHSADSISSQAPYWDKFVLTLFLTLTFLCFMFSTFYHIFRSHSVEAYRTFLILDVASIGVQIFSCNVVIMYFEMACFPELRFRYHATLVILMIIIVAAVPFLIRGGRTSMRTALFIFMAISGLVSHFHHAYERQWNWNHTEYHTFFWLFATYVFSGTGLVIRRAQFPECYFKGKFHIFFSSHQIFHMLVGISSFSMHMAYGHFLTQRYTCPVRP